MPGIKVVELHVLHLSTGIHPVEMTGQELPDTQCGFRLMNLETWTKLPVNAGHFEIESDVLFAFAIHKYSIEFVPIEVIYKSEQSKIHPARDTVRWIRWWWRVRRYSQRDLRPKPVLPLLSGERG